MTDQGEIKSKKGIGCLGVLLIILLALALIAGSIYIFLPKILSSAVSGGTVSSLLPKAIREDTSIFRDLISDNINQLEEYGLSKDEAVRIISSLDPDTLNECMEDIQQSSITNSSALIDLISEYIDLSSADLNKIKKDNYVEFDEGELNQVIEDLKTNPIMGKSGFKLLKRTAIDILKSHKN